MALTPLNFPTAPTVGQIYPTPAVTGQPTYQWDGTDWLSYLTLSKTTLFRGWIAGLTLSTAGSSATFSVSPGEAADSTNTAKLALASACAKTTAAWALGTGVGGLDSGVIANATWYHVHSILRVDTGVTDVLFSLSATAPVLPANYTLFRRIGSIKTNSSGQWFGFVQDGDIFMWMTSIADLQVSNPGIAAITRTLSVPSGVRVQALISAASIATSLADVAGSVLISDLLISDQPPTTTGAWGLIMYPGAATTNWQYGYGSFPVWTNTAAQVRSRLQISGASTQLIISTNGWIDRRGRDA